MKSRIKSFFSGIAEACNPNKASFSGAVDIIVIERSDGTLASTPFHVKFGRFKLIKSNKKPVSIYINEQLSPISMELTKSGRANFIRKVESKPQSEDVKAESVDEPEILHSEEDEEEEEELERGIDPELLDSSLELPENREEIKAEPLPQLTRSYRSNLGIIAASNNLSSDELKKLNLQPNMNKIHYEIETKKSKILLESRVFLWPDTSKIVVSDIDGTLTKSDVMGHIYYYMGKDWSRGGVAHLYRNIISRGYKILYLTSRSMSQYDSTLGLLNFVNQNEERLPEGPIILSPNGMLRSIVREISNYSQVFKIAALNEVLQMFPQDKQPFYSGFGNRNGDSVAYNSVGIPSDRIYILTKAKKKKNEVCSKIKDFSEVSLNFEEIFPQLA